ncbi:hypothetical protein P6144_05435 [Sphingomonas sp. HITSZ_GF]|uniref:hypothetical protein n=1 Tax=Sphingomonas sp. HITSZ_GF TaxID=3037247 RepID=UPI00240CE580|nr:hypothetical protein [Sphingomonas sp. HITSZ_GF]MDG2533080.1 hypothetical protein [Sphingomonas sp. HITSZ_GF]
MADERWENVGGAEETWDHAAAARLEGATVLVGLTHRGAEGDWREQFFGTVMEVDPGEGITLRLEGKRRGEIVTLPPLLDAFEPADPGIYELKDADDRVIDPDYIASWTLSRPH